MHKANMKYFDNLQQLVNYVPNCLICGKQIPILIQGRWFYPPDVDVFKSIKTTVQDDCLLARHRKFDFKINLSNNKIIHGEEYFKDILKSRMFVFKKCSSCHIYVTLSPILENPVQAKISKFSIFPTLAIDTEEVQFTTKGGKKLFLHKDYHKSYSSYQVFPEGIISLSVNNKRQHIPNEYLNLEKIKDFSSLKNKISTILTFQ